MIRAFLAVELPEGLKKSIAQIQDQVRGGIAKTVPPTTRLQWVRPDSMHLTLKFLGDIEEAQIESIKQALALPMTAFPRFSVEVDGLGVFPHLGMPRVLWVGLSETVDGQSGHQQGLLRLVEEVEAVLERLGFPRETRPFHPHLTLARMKEQAREVGRALSTSGLLTRTHAMGTLSVRAVALVKSELRPSGAVYTRLWEVPLGVR
ncbi:MAG: RNA 2',3'-cyclic phosphodiesterase [Nitrospira sp.]|nr:RNA 2',3'-cyclic phosphodiesterase [Nitrospira sp.]